jgi:SAM-dependent methyltransferase
MAKKTKKAAKAVKQTFIPAAPAELLKLNLGAGKVRMEGYLSVDSIPFEGLDLVADLAKPWPWADNSVSNIHMSHVLEHFTASERVHIFNEAWRVLAKGGQAYIITPMWSSTRAYGDMTHQWPPVSEFFYNYLWAEWRKGNAPHLDSEYVGAKGFNCDFDFQGGYGMSQEIMGFSDDRRNYAMKNYKDAASDLHATITVNRK